jgi:hypothetical protein
MDQNQDLQYQIAALALGEYGVDLRRPVQPPALSQLDNARFLDERTAVRRNGYVGQSLVDGETFPVLGAALGASSWLYGHGLVTTAGTADTHHPVAGRGAAVLELDGSAAVWTGDRVLIPRDGGDRALGSSYYWLGQGLDPEAYPGGVPRGIPAHLPLVTDEELPVNDTQIDAALTTKFKVVVTASATKVSATVIERATGTILSTTDVSGTTAAPGVLAVVSVGDVPTVLWSDTSDSKLRIRRYVGGGWTTEDFITSDPVTRYDAVVTTDFSTLYVAYLTGTTIKLVERDWRNQVSVRTLATSHTPTAASAVALAIGASGTLAVAYLVFTAPSSWVTYIDTLSAAGAVVATYSNDEGATEPTYIAVTPRLKPDTYTLYSYKGGTLVMMVQDVRTTLHNVGIASRPFNVGAETFVWLRAGNSGTCLLLAGSVSPYVVGAADRETGKAIADALGVAPPRPALDPLGDGTLLTWTRQYVHDTVTGTPDYRPRLGTMDFLPALSTARYGRSLYTSGSCVKNWDGRVLRDAGFHDYPKITGNTDETGGGLTAGGVYSWKVRAVRYNDLGERFESAAVAYGPITLTNTKATLTINGVLCSEDGITDTGVTLEVYRQYLDGPFLLEGTVANSRTGAVTFVSSASDDAIADNAADPHGVGGELERWAPLGCAYLASVGDRLWGAGGQVGTGRVQFSLAIDDGFGAGFDDLAGYADVADDEITTIAGLNDAIMISTARRWYVLGGGGPDNEGNGGFSTPELVLAAGASSHAGTALTPAGTAFWSDGGPMLLTSAFQTEPIGAAVRALAETLTPVGVQVDTARQEVVWFCGGTALLMNYATGAPRWSIWSTPQIAGVSDHYLVTANGRLLRESSAAHGDDGAPFAVTIRTGNISPQQLLDGANKVRRIGVSGEYNGPHQLRFRVYYNGSPGWSDEFVWSPSDGTWLTAVSDMADLTPAALDAMTWRDHSGAYLVANRVTRQDCAYLQVEITDIGAAGPTFTPHELSFELAVARPGYARNPVNTISRTR